MKTCTIPIGWLLGLLLALALPAQLAWSLELPVRVSVNFILNSSGNRPATGSINTDAEVNAQVERANEILKENSTEYKFHLLGINEVSGQSAYYGLDSTSANRDAIRSAAQANPSTWHWRTDAINMYINGGTGSAISDFPPDNNIVLFNQNIWDMTMMHEVGHSVYLYHTHQGPSDYCADTLPDNEYWNRDEIASNSYGVVYAGCTPAQQALVDNTWENLMSYHDGDNRHIITPQQGDRVSDLTYDDLWMLTDTPVYIKSAEWPTGANGSWDNPYATIQAAINAGQDNNRTLVLMSSGLHLSPYSVLTNNTKLITRRGTSIIEEMPPPYELRHDLENSTNNAVAQAVEEAQTQTRAGDEEGSLAAIRRAAELAKGKERHALLIEIGDRLKAKDEFDEAETFYSLAAAESDQPDLKKRFERKAKKMKVLKAKKLERIQRQQADSNDTEED